MNKIFKLLTGGVYMSGKFSWKKFKEIDLSDSFFDTLKDDYPEFPVWFSRKQCEDKSALVYCDDLGVGAFLYLKKENVDGDISPIVVNGKELPQIPRLKIGTLRLAERIRKQRLGEGALGVSLWHWKNTEFDEIYVTAFEKHLELINLFERFGFICVGKNERGENVYIKNRKELSFEDPYKSFPFVSKSFDFGGLIPINDEYHDKLFPYSELIGGTKNIFSVTAGNGITKVFIATPYDALHYKVGMPVFIYRIHTGLGPKKYKSVVTSFCTISKVDIVKEKGIQVSSCEDFIKQAGNKTIYTSNELQEIYATKKTVVIIELVYNGYFGKGHNVNFNELKENGLFEDYPYNVVYTEKEFEKILEMGDINVQNTIVD